MRGCAPVYFLFLWFLKTDKKNGFVGAFSFRSIVIGVWCMHIAHIHPSIHSFVHLDNINIWNYGYFTGDCLPCGHLFHLTSNICRFPPSASSAILSRNSIFSRSLYIDAHIRNCISWQWEFPLNELKLCCNSDFISDSQSYFNYQQIYQKINRPSLNISTLVLRISHTGLRSI